MSFPFGPAALAVPVNLLDALARATEAQYTDGIGGVAQIIGGEVTKVWDPAVVGINGQLPVVVATKWVCAGTNWLDLTPCKHFAAIIHRVQGAGVAHATPVMTLQAQYRISSLDLPPAGRQIGGAINDLANGIFDICVAGSGITWPAEASPMEQREVVAWSPTTAATSGARILPVTIGAGAVRFILSWLTLDPTNGGADPSVYSMTLVGSS